MKRLVTIFLVTLGLVVPLVPAANAETFTLPYGPVNGATITSNPRTIVDQPDDLTGYQVHIIYVVPSDGTDRNLDTNGRIATWLDQAAAYTKRQIGLTPVFDKYMNSYDIGFLHSKYTFDDLFTSPLEKLRDEISTPELNQGKTVGFVVDGHISDEYCGQGGRPSDNFFVTLDVDCWEDIPSKNDEKPEPFIARAIIHEWFHTLGVEHVCIGSDLMWSSKDGCVLKQDSRSEIDETRSNYIRPNNSKLDISLLPVWLESNRSQKIYEQAKKSYFPSSIYRSKAINFWATFDLVSEGAQAVCKTFVDGVPILTSTEIQYGGATISCNTTMPQLAKMNAKVTMEISWEDLWTYSQISQQTYLGSTSSASKVCTGQFCKVGDVFETNPNLCWKNEGFAALQILTNGEWINLKAHNLSLVDGVKVGCSNSNKYSVSTRIRLLHSGLFTFRWVIFEDASRLKISSAGANAPFTIEAREK